MRILKPIVFTAIASLLFASCKSITTIPVPAGAENSINITAKKAPLSEDENHRWSHADLEKDSIPGMSIAKAYEFIQGKKGVEVIVGIADSGVDVEHEDLKDVAWVNPKEVAGNNKDDDKNGYVDDIHGWNFLGSKDGSIVNADQLEITRIVKRGMEKFGDKNASEIAPADTAEYEQFLKDKKRIFGSSRQKSKRERKFKENRRKIESDFCKFCQSKTTFRERCIYFRRFKRCTTRR
jgi:hypothetical protein